MACVVEAVPAPAWGPVVHSSVVVMMDKVARGRSRHYGMIKTLSSLLAFLPPIAIFPRAQEPWTVQQAPLLSHASQLPVAC